MTIHNIKISDFKSLYGSHYFDFDKMKGLIKLSGPIGSGKTSIGEALIWGLYGNVKGQTNPGLVAWNCKACEVEINLTSKDKEVHIVRNIREPLIVEINGKTLSASNKKDTQAILEEEIFDIPKLAVTKMCIISFNAFNSLASMGVGETKQFLDDIFGFKLFSEYNDEVKIERKGQENEAIRLQSVYDENLEQIEHLKQKQISQTKELTQTIDVEALNKKRAEYIEQGIAEKTKKEGFENKIFTEKQEVDTKIKECQDKMTEAKTLGQQAKSHYNTFKTGICPTCGQKIDQSHIDEYKQKYDDYIEIYKEWDKKKKEYELDKINIDKKYYNDIETCKNNMTELKQKIVNIDAELKSYNDSVQLLNDNYDVLIKELEEKIKKIKEQLDKCDLEIAEWNEMNELFSKTLRYNLLETLIPHINRSIQFFINKLEQNYKIEYDQEFKAHIYVDGWDKEISYNNLSTGQRKSLDLAIIFGILQNIIANVDLNILFLDELFSNMDVNARNIMISLLQENMGDDKTIFIINHAEMGDDMFSHKIRVKLEKKKIISASQKKGEPVIVQASKYEQEF
jgi:DNA repair exonuclease SbcCD ATPase subunit